MAEVYVLSSVTNASPVELTGGRVGSFKMKSSGDDMHVGDNTVTNSTGALLVASLQHDFYVTSPDEIYIVSAGSTSNVTVFHNR